MVIGTSFGQQIKRFCTMRFTNAFTKSSKSEGLKMETMLYRLFNPQVGDHSEIVKAAKPKPYLWFFWFVDEMALKRGIHSMSLVLTKNRLIEIKNSLDSDFKCNTKASVVGTDSRIKHLAFRSQVFFLAGGSTHLEPCVSPDR